MGDGSEGRGEGAFRAVPRHLCPAGMRDLPAGNRIFRATSPQFCSVTIRMLSGCDEPFGCPVPSLPVAASNRRAGGRLDAKGDRIGQHRPPVKSRNRHLFPLDNCRQKSIVTSGALPLRGPVGRQEWGTLFRVPGSREKQRLQTVSAQRHSERVCGLSAHTRG